MNTSYEIDQAFNEIISDRPPEGPRFSETHSHMWMEAKKSRIEELADQLKSSNPEGEKQKRIEKDQQYALRRLLEEYSEIGRYH